jgi:hypothetical protein
VEQQQKNPEVTSPRPSLPATCATRLLTSREPIIIKRGEEGYYLAKSLKTDEDIEAYNREMGANLAHVKAMELGSLCGWNSPGADPDRWDPITGKSRREA